MTEISEPTLLVNREIVQKNIQNLADKATRDGVAFKPHFKTHQSRSIGHWFRSFGVDGITVSSLKMADYFAKAGWNDITIAFPAIPIHADRINQLARQADITILLSNTEAFESLNEAIKQHASVFIEIDTGANRTGFLPSKTEEIKSLAHKINGSKHLTFKGFYSHPGHSYRCRSQKEIEKVHNNTLQIIHKIKADIELDFKKLTACIGDTPCCSVADNFEGIDQISPGNFVFYDLMQVQIGSCSSADIAVCLASPVIARYPERHEIAVHAGAIHLSKESLNENGQILYGKVVSLNSDLSWNEPIDGCYVKSLSQEHGIVKCSPSFFESITIGDPIGILPVHSCLTADAMKEYMEIQTKTRHDHLQAAKN